MFVFMYLSFLMTALTLKLNLVGFDEQCMIELLYIKGKFMIYVETSLKFFSNHDREKYFQSVQVFANLFKSLQIFSSLIKSV